MKKTLALLLTTCLFLTACASGPTGDLSSGSSAPAEDQVAQRVLDFCTRYSALDFESAMVFLGHQSTSDEGDEWENYPSSHPMIKAMQAYTTQNTVTIKDCQVSGDRAIVTVSVEYIDLNGKFEDVKVEALAASGIAQEMTPDEIENITEEEALPLLCDALVAYASDHEFEKTTADFMVSLKKVDNDWILISMDEELPSALLSYLDQG